MKIRDLISVQELSEILGINEPNTRIWIKKNLREDVDYKKFAKVYMVDKNAVEKVKNKK